MRRGLPVNIINHSQHARERGTSQNRDGKHVRVILPYCLPFSRLAQGRERGHGDISEGMKHQNSHKDQVREQENEETVYSVRKNISSLAAPPVLAILTQTLPPCLAASLRGRRIYIFRAEGFLYSLLVMYLWNELGNRSDKEEGM